MNRNYAFDDCSILNMCKIKVPASFELFLNKSELIPDNYSKLINLNNQLINKKCKKFMFIPSNFEKHTIRIAKRMLGDLNPTMIRGLNSQLIDRLNEFIDSVKDNFQPINKSEEIRDLRDLFIENEKELKKERNLPEDDDLKIMKGYAEFTSEQDKLLISQDEHFWGYKNLIENHLNISIIPEGNCGECTPK
jgi:hypothetical protein